MTKVSYEGGVGWRYLVSFVVPAIASCAFALDGSDYTRGSAGESLADAGTGGPQDADANTIAEASGGDGAPASICRAPGELCADGTVYVGTLGASTLYATPCDLGQSRSTLGCAGSRKRLPYNDGNDTGGVFVGATATDDGKGNTAKLLAADADAKKVGKQPHQAAAACAALDAGGHSDFYLPAADEIEVAYASRVAIGGFDDGAGAGYYWTSTETHDGDTPLNAARFDFSSDYTYLDGDGKPLPAMIRCFRRTP